MKATIIQAPNIQDYMQIGQTVTLSEDNTILIIYKRLFRSDNIIVDIYKNNISDDDKIVSGKVLCVDARLYNMNPNVDFNYVIDCVDLQAVDENITPQNLHNFYLQFTNLIDGEDWTFTPEMSTYTPITTTTEA